MTSAFGGQHSIQLSYGCALGTGITETGRHMQRGIVPLPRKAARFQPLNNSFASSSADTSASTSSVVL